MLPTLDYKMAMAAGWDAANRQMRKAGRSAWSEEDYQLAAATANQLLDKIKQREQLGGVPCTE